MLWSLLHSKTSMAPQCLLVQVHPALTICKAATLPGLFCSCWRPPASFLPTQLSPPPPAALVPSVCLCLIVRTPSALKEALPDHPTPQPLPKIHPEQTWQTQRKGASRRSRVRKLHYRPEPRSVKLPPDIPARGMVDTILCVSSFV